MTCLNPEQLSAIALSLDGDEQQSAHAYECPACRAALAEIRQVVGHLAAVHADVNRSHVASRAQLLASLSRVQVSTRSPRIWRRLAQQLNGLSVRQRIAAGGIGFSALVSYMLILVALNSVGRLSAMERMVKAIREVKSYSYKMFNQDTFVRKGDSHPSTVIHTATTYWQEPRSVRYDEKLVRFEAATPQNDDEGRLLVRLSGIHPTGRRGMMIISTSVKSPSLANTYYWVPELSSTDPDDIGRDSPITRLRRVREGAGRVLRELGTKSIDGKAARGYIMALDGANPGSGLDALEVWVDPETDLPFEFGYETKTAEHTCVFRITDCRWNIELDAKLFDTTPPEDYEDITPPTSEKEIAEMIAALKLYTQISGGHYPQGPTFDADVVQNDMRQRAGFSGPAQEAWKHDPRYTDIQQSGAGLRSIARVVRNTYNAGYYGEAVGPRDTERALLWWMANAAPETYRVIYGDLRTALLPLTEWAKVVPPEAAANHLPDEG
jgi:hypothetical protein